MVAFTLTGFIASIALAYVTSFIATTVKIMTDAGHQQLCALMQSVKICGSSPGSSMQQNILLDSAGSITFILTRPAGPASSSADTCSNGMSSGLLAPKMDTTELPSTPVLGPQAGGDSIPQLDLDSSRGDTPLITASPYAQDEGLTFVKGTSLWQGQDGVPSASLGLPRGSPAIITESSFDKDERLKFTSETSLWQPTGSATAQQRCTTDHATYDCSASGLQLDHCEPLRLERDGVLPKGHTSLATEGIEITDTAGATSNREVQAHDIRYILRL
jgi:hypothetical protein